MCNCVILFVVLFVILFVILSVIHTAGGVARVKKGINYRAAKANGRKLLKFYLSFERLSLSLYKRGTRLKTKDTLGR